MVVVVTAGLCIILLTLCTLSHTSEFDRTKVDGFINGFIGCRTNKNPGLAASAVKDGHVVFADGYNVSDTMTRRPVTNQTLFGIASMSKAFAAALMVKQLRDRKLSLHTKLSDLLPEGFQFSAREFTQYATIRDLMTHCLGVPPNQMIRLDKTLTRKKAARRIRYFRPVHKFRH
ncbi:hypothetical protein DPMN_111494 [Dreissena polymorpha]|uniref:Beta-lactamase-related domain-containing protein n=1 Tax=Dreissena polymorpha TaxID=45954 RepID=A0A9D4KE05_DREPO|nr:hypothetical protein DPMN_111494 [Dreissena polymorpha]